MRARPLASTGIAAFAALFGILASNAMYHQPGRHPKPLLVTRPVAGDVAAAADRPETAEESGLLPVPLVSELQTALAKAGYYGAAIDGRPGRETAAAIRAFQSDNALPVDGEASPRLLAAIESVTGAAAANERVASLEPGRTADDATGAIGEPVKPALSPDLVRRIQAGLAAAHVAALKPDGIMGEQTRGAIRSFEAQQGLPVTGTPDERLLKRLQAIGALR